MGIFTLRIKDHKVKKLIQSHAATAENAINNENVNQQNTSTIIKSHNLLNTEDDYDNSMSSNDATKKDANNKAPWYYLEFIKAEQALPMIKVIAENFCQRAAQLHHVWYPFTCKDSPSVVISIVNQYVLDDYSWPVDRIRIEIAAVSPSGLSLLLRWFWHRIKDGIFTWESYILFKKAEIELGQPLDAFAKILPSILPTKHHFQLIVHFFKCLCLTTVYEYSNKIPKQDLFRLATWWLFPLEDFKDQDNSLSNTSWDYCSKALIHLYYAFVRSYLTDLPEACSRSLNNEKYPPIEKSFALEPCIFLKFQLESSDSDIISAERTFLNVYSLLQKQLPILNYDHIELDSQCKNYSEKILAYYKEPASYSYMKDPENITDVKWLNFSKFGFESSVNLAKKIADDLVSRPSTSPEIHSDSYMIYKAEAGRLKATDLEWNDFVKSGFGEHAISERCLGLQDPKKKIPNPLDVEHHADNPEDSESHDNLQIIEESKRYINHALYNIYLDCHSPECPSFKKKIFENTAIFALESEFDDSRWLIAELKLKSLNLHTLSRKQSKLKILGISSKRIKDNNQNRSVSDSVEDTGLMDQWNKLWIKLNYPKEAKFPGPTKKKFSDPRRIFSDVPKNSDLESVEPFNDRKVPLLSKKSEQSINSIASKSSICSNFTPVRCKTLSSRKSSSSHFKENFSSDSSLSQKIKPDIPSKSLARFKSKEDTVISSKEADRKTPESVRSDAPNSCKPVKNPLRDLPKDESRKDDFDISSSDEKAEVDDHKQMLGHEGHNRNFSIRRKPVPDKKD